MAILYGNLKILTVFSKNGIKFARCQCSCGNETTVYLSNLKAGRTQSCGCMEHQFKSTDLTNKNFGLLTAIEPTNERKNGCVVWKCRCECGTITYKNSGALQRGQVKSCGCMRKTKKTKQDLVKQSSGYYAILHPTDEKLNWKTKWVCQCQCGATFEATFANLYYEHTKSCGCLRRKEYRTCIDGTVVECLNSKVSSNNTSGVKGVYLWGNKWISYINFRGRRYHLGTYDDLEKAYFARMRGVQKYFYPLLKKAKLKNDRNCEIEKILYRQSTS